MSKPRILLVSGVRGDTRRYRNLHLAEQCLLLGVTPDVTHSADPGLISLVQHNEYQAAILHRVELDGYVNRLITALKGQNTLILYDTDDLIFDPEAIQFIDSPDFADPIRRWFYRDKVIRQRNALLACDAALASTAYLADRINRLGLPAIVHRNAFSFEMAYFAEKALREPSPNVEEIIIGYASGTPTHDKDFALIAPVLQTIMREHTEVSLHLIGPLDPGLGWEGLGTRIKRIPAVPWRELPERMAKFDINLAPLISDNPFAQSKSAIKYLEAALVHCPTIATPTAAFQHAIRHGENGLLAENETAWIRNLTYLVTDQKYRKRLGDTAASEVHQNDAPPVRATQLRDTLSDLNLSLKDKPFWELHEKPKIAPNLETFPGWDPDQEQQPTNWQLGLYTLRQRGPLPLLGGMWIWLRRLFSPIFPFKNRSR